MAKDTSPTKTPPAITGVDLDTSVSVDIGMSDGSASGARDGGTSASYEFDRTAPITPTPTDPAAPAATGEEEAIVGSDTETTAADDTTQAPAQDTEALEAYDAAKPEVVAKYEARYFNADGKLNLQAVTQEFWASAGADGKGGTLREDTYRFIEDTIGVTKEAAKAIEAGLVAQQAQESAAFWQRVGGKQRYSDALTWGKANYSEADRARFNAAINGADPGARSDVIDALLSRFDKATGGGRSNGRRGPPNRNAPARSVTSTAGAGSGPGAGAVPYASQAAYTEAFTAAITAERDARSPEGRRKAAAERAKIQADGRASSRFWQRTTKG